MTACMCRSKENLGKLDLSFYHVGSGDQGQVATEPSYQPYLNNHFFIKVE